MVAAPRRTRRNTRRKILISGPLQLRVIVDESVKIYRLPKNGELSIGRAEGCDVRIEEASVSRHHAVLVLDDGDLRVRDAGSTYGLRVRGERVEPNRDVPIEPGDAIEAGGAVMVVELAVSESGAKGSTRPKSRPRPRPR